MPAQQSRLEVRVLELAWLIPGRLSRKAEARQCIAQRFILHVRCWLCTGDVMYVFYFNLLVFFSGVVALCLSTMEKEYFAEGALSLFF